MTLAAAGVDEQPERQRQVVPAREIVNRPGPALLRQHEIRFKCEMAMFTPDSDHREISATPEQSLSLLQIIEEH